MPSSEQLTIQNTLNSLVDSAYTASKRNGFHDNDNESSAVPAKMMLVITELAEACEAIRKPVYHDTNITGKIFDELYELDAQQFKACFELDYKDTASDEIADTFIRLFDLCGMMGMHDIGYRIMLKMRYNSTRNHMHGKRF